MKDFLLRNWYEVILTLSVLYNFVKSWQQSSKQKFLEKNHLHTLEENFGKFEKNVWEAIKDIKDDIDDLRRETQKQGERISRIEGRFNGK